MGMTDPIADMLTRLRNAGIARHKKIDLPSSRLKVAITTVLRNLGYIKSFKVVDEDRFETLRIYLKYDDEELPIIHEIQRVSKPSRRVYVGRDDIPKVKSGLGCAIISTSQGVLSDEEARKAQIGGEVICSLW